MTDGEDKEWILILFTNNGSVGAINNLTRERAKQLYRELMPHQEPFDVIGGDLEEFIDMGLVFPNSDKGIKRITFFHPSGEQPDPWEGSPRRKVDLSPLQESANNIRRRRAERKRQKQIRQWMEDLPMWKWVGYKLGLVKIPDELPEPGDFWKELF